MFYIKLNKQNEIIFQQIYFVYCADYYYCYYNIVEEEIFKLFYYCNDLNYKIVHLNIICNREKVNGIGNKKQEKKNRKKSLNDHFIH